MAFCTAKHGILETHPSQKDNPPPTLPKGGSLIAFFQLTLIG